MTTLKVQRKRLLCIHLVILKQKKNTSAGYISTKPKWQKSNLVLVLAMKRIV